MRFKIGVILLLAITLYSCREEQLSADPSLKLTFSKDTVCFDTVFTTIGTSTLRLMVYNKNANALSISSIWLDNNTAFKVNVDGENDLTQLKDLQINGGDSLFVFIKVNIDPLKQNNPVLVEDNLHFAVNEKTQTVHLEAVGQDVFLIKTPERLTIKNNFTFSAAKPYLIYDTIAVQGKLTIKPGARLYFHDKAALMAYNDVNAVGELQKPIILQGDRTDNIFENVPYAYVAGMWSGFYLVDLKNTDHKTYKFDYVEILSANVGLYAFSQKTGFVPSMQLLNSRIHNHAVYGLVLQNINALVVNTELSNAAAYCAYLEGGQHTFIHSTIASFFNSTDVRIQSSPREDVAAVYINNLSKDGVPTHTSFRNCIITGIRSNNLLVATPFAQYYTDTIANNYIKADSLHIANAHNNTYWQKNDSDAFVNTFYKYKEYIYYDFRLAEHSPARGIGDGSFATKYSTDRLGNPRPTTKPDAGCYQYK